MIDLSVFSVDEEKICPLCSSSIIGSTMVIHDGVDTNICWCSCGWEGKVFESQETGRERFDSQVKAIKKYYDGMDPRFHSEEKV